MVCHIKWPKEFLYFFAISSSVFFFGKFASSIALQIDLIPRNRERDSEAINEFQFQWFAFSSLSKARKLLAKVGQKKIYRVYIEK